MNNGHMYRSDIDGLRALAILSVVIYHAYPEALSGGFMGVDVFFAISGYLISGIIFRQQAEGKFKFTRFFARRIRRIFPALITMLFITFIAGWFLLLAAELKILGKHIAAGAAFAQNFVLCLEAGYFDTASELKPLAHLWSLAIEEQYYLVYPVVVAVVWYFGFNVPVVIGILMIISFLLNIFQIDYDPVSTFFLPQTRVWELLAGGLLAYSHVYKYGNKPVFDRTRVLNNLLAALGIVLIVLPMFLVDKNFSFPGWWALCPVMGTLVMIQAGSITWINNRILSNRYIVGVGLISYPLYLWHWPLLAFARIEWLGIPPPEFRFAIILTSVVLAILTYKFIEKPVRSQAISVTQSVILITLMTVTGMAGYLTYRLEGIPSRDMARNQFDLYFENTAPEFRYVKTHDLYRAYRMDCDFWDWSNGGAVRNKIDASCYTPYSNEVLFLWGDSHVQHLNHGLSENLPDNISILQIATSACRPAIVDADRIYGDDHICEKSNQLAFEKIKATKPKIVIIAQLEDHDKTDFEAMARQLKGLGVGHVILMGPIPRWNPELYKIVIRRAWDSPLTRLDSNLLHKVLQLDEKMKKQYSHSKHIEYVSIIDYLCNASGCLIQVGENRLENLSTWDYGHFTLPMSEYVAKGLLLPIISKDFKL